MVDFPIFPVLPGQSWSVNRAPHFATRIQRGTSGRELRLADQPNPIWEWTVRHDGVLRDDNDVRAGANVGPGIGYNELRKLMGLFLATQGSFFPFVYWDPTDCEVFDFFLGNGDGVTVDFPFVRWLITGGPLEPLFGVNLFGSAGLTAALGFAPPVPLVFVNGALQTYSTNYTFYNTFQNTDSNWGSGIHFTSPPPMGQPVASTFFYLFLCRFNDDSLDFENFMYQLWIQAGAKFRSLV